VSKGRDHEKFPGAKNQCDLQRFIQEARHQRKNVKMEGREEVVKLIGGGGERIRKKHDGKLAIKAVKPHYNYNTHRRGSERIESSTDRRRVLT